jgi:hypothetical protein
MTDHGSPVHNSFETNQTQHNMNLRHVKFLVLLLITCASCARDRGPQELVFESAHENGVLANEGFRRCNDYMISLLGHADSQETSMNQIISGMPKMLLLITTRLWY